MDRYRYPVPRARLTAADLPRERTIYLVRQDRAIVGPDDLDLAAAADAKRIQRRLADPKLPGLADRTHRLAEIEALREGCDTVAGIRLARSLRPMAVWIVLSWAVVFGVMFAVHLVAGLLK